MTDETSSAEYPIEISGHRIDIGDGRSVWAGRYDNSWYVTFTGPAGTTRLRLSYAGAGALVQLLNAPEKENVNVALRWIVDHVVPGENQTQPDTK